jgi:hypothetical protein
VIKATRKGVIIRLDFVNGSISTGDKVQFAGGRYPATINYERSVLRTPMNRRKFVYPFDFSGGAIGSQAYVLPTFLFQGMVTPRIAIGVEGIYTRQQGTTSSLRALGALLTVNYYSWRYFRGFWFRGGSGLLFTNADSGTNSENATSLMGIATVGFKFGLGWGINIGLSVGGMYIQRPSTTSITLDFNEFQGVGTATLGLSL